MTQIEERQVMGSPPRQCAGSFPIVCQEVSCQIQHPTVNHLFYPPDLVSCDFYLFFKVKSALKGTRFGSAEVMKEKAASIL
ncbi:hypothetical protein TNCV_4342111 [Trichonephila clavipes]|nr:hypothetical protein TNCV_4342111 [Trichonephila clavipes]